ncbi:betaine/proline/choline family ABC transporter ATP-binding protein [Abyssisolibacter fermentans]|uniref:betaine/proline/choline family ABC transporter ATP-binding protein n=1 Tax=Abyssisolibacter fermentans TaxID=1766203 RepID=UPI000832DEEF|nr:betaine/proline/choline family ABC transporter ATP-binding protein [Abyssisolibacter fermentans]
MIKFENVSKTYNNGFKAIKNLNLHIKKGEIFVLIGPSGCGKTTTMKMINRLIELTEGAIYINGKSIYEQDVVELRRNIGYVIQQIGLLPHMTIAENVALVPKLKKQDKKIYTDKVDELLNMVGLDPKIYSNKYPSELSGGQQQRIGVIRALAADPPIILMDEPFSALDPISREQLQNELIKLQVAIQKTIVFVTHDMDEALKIADRICIMKEGQIVQLCTPDKLIRHPANSFVRDFIGEHRLKQASKQNLPELKNIITKPIVATEDKDLIKAMKMLYKNKCEYIVIVDKYYKFIGIVKAWDIYNNCKNKDMILKDIMKTDVHKLSINRKLEHAIEILSKTDSGCLPVVGENEKFKGIITNDIIVKVLTDRIIERRAI